MDEGQLGKKRNLEYMGIEEGTGWGELAKEVEEDNMQQSWKNMQEEQEQEKESKNGGKLRKTRVAISQGKVEGRNICRDTGR